MMNAYMILIGVNNIMSFVFVASNNKYIDFIIILFYFKTFIIDI